MLFLISFTLFATTIITVAALEILHPLSYQLPPLVHPSFPYTFTILPDSFAPYSSANLSASNSMIYSAHNLPAWLSFNPSTRTFSGLPPTNVTEGEDLGRWITVIGNSSVTGTSAIDGFELLFLSSPPPAINVPLNRQLGSAADRGDGCTLQSDGTLRVPPTWSFSLGFEYNTFTSSSGAQIFYSAVERGTTSLPDWLVFDNRTVTFDCLRAPDEGVYTFDLWGSEREGFGDVRQSFTLHVSNVEELGDGGNSTAGDSWSDFTPSIGGLTVKEGGIRVWNVTIGSKAKYTIDPNDFRMADNGTLISSDIKSVTVDLSSLPFLSFSSSQMEISGVFPPSFSKSDNEGIPLSLTTTFNLSITTEIAIQVFPDLFTAPTLEPFTVYAGKSFTYDLSPAETAPGASYSASFSPSQAGDWMVFDDDTLILKGTVPDPVPEYGNVQIAFAGTDAANGITSSTMMVMKLEEEEDGSGGDDQEEAGGGHGHLTKAGKIALAVSGAFVGAFILFAVLMACCRRHYSDSDDGRDGVPVAAPSVAASPALLSPALNGPNFDIGRRSSVTAVATTGRPSVSSVGALVGEKTAGAEKDGPGWIGVVMPTSPERAYVPGPLEQLVHSSEKRGAAKRMDLLKIFGRKSDAGVIGGRVRGGVDSANSLFGMGIDRSTPITAPEISFVRDEMRRDSWRSHSSSSEGESEESGFYSSRTGSSGTGSDRERRSLPRQRRDFVPRPSRIPGSSNESSGEEGRSTDRETAIRLISSSESDRERETNNPYGYRGINTDSMVFPSTFNLTITSVDGQTSTSAEALVHGDSYSSSVQPKLMQFGAGGGGRTSSVNKGERGDLIDPMFEDASDEVNSQRNRKWSTHQPTQGSPATSAIFFDSPNPPPPRSPGVYSNSNKSTVSHDFYNHPNATVCSEPKGMKMHRTSTSPLDVITITVSPGEPFHFTPSIHPPPQASIGSPGRAIQLMKTSYRAVLDYPTDVKTDGRPLPGWINFDTGAMEFWGIPSSSDGIGDEVRVRVVEKKTPSRPSSPTRRGGSMVSSVKDEETETIVGRFVLNVVDKKGAGEKGGVRVLSY
ncbi:hypothetical protein BT69DRAFT_1337434 [Atractiella rhizophila]|nr:hypothetical protein BT69DRAFT_1337434 [Atractiella rhizophila]